MAKTITTSSDWVQYNHLTDSYETKDGTSVSASLVNGVVCLADAIHIAAIRDKQRKSNYQCGMRKQYV